MVLPKDPEQARLWRLQRSQIAKQMWQRPDYRAKQTSPLGLVCSKCGSETTYIQKSTGRQNWYLDDEGNRYCSRCRQRYLRPHKFTTLTEAKAYQTAVLLSATKKRKLENRSKIRKCEQCGSTETYVDKTGCPKWYNCVGRNLCNGCRSTWQRNTDPKYKVRERIYRQTHKQQGNASKKRYRENTRNILFQLLGDKCVRCGYTDRHALQFDHKSGGGRSEARQHGNSQVMIRYYSKHPEEAKEKLQVLCANCNWIKLYEQNEFRAPTVSSLLIN